MEQKRRRHFTKQQKMMILQDHFSKKTPIQVLARLHSISPITLYSWKRTMSQDESKINIEELLKENAQLKKDKNKLLKKVGESALREEVAQDIIEFYKKKIFEQELEEQKNSSNKKRKGARK